MAVRVDQLLNPPPPTPPSTPPPPRPRPVIRDFIIGRFEGKPEWALNVTDVLRFIFDVDRKRNPFGLTMDTYADFDALLDKYPKGGVLQPSFIEPLVTGVLEKLVDENILASKDYEGVRHYFLPRVPEDGAGAR